MEAKVISAFTDRHTGKVHVPGETYAGDDARIAELAEGGYLEMPEKPKRTARARKTQKQ